MLEILIDSVFSPQKGIDEMLLKRKTGFDGFFASPVFAVGFTFDKDLTSATKHILIPSISSLQPSTTAGATAAASTLPSSKYLERAYT